MDFTRLKAFQDTLVRWRIPGCDCMVTKDHETVYRYFTGWADREAGRAMAGGELYFFWSASKLITTCLGLRLLEEGRFAMNDPISDVLPEFRDMRVRRVINGQEEIVTAKRPILARHLFTMTAGFDYNFATPAVTEVRQRTDGRCPTREVVRAIAASPLCFEPGERWQYSLCHDVLGAYIEALAGRRLRDYAKETIFDPLGMTDTSYNLPDAGKLSRMAVQYNWRDDLGKAVPTNNTCGHILGPEYDSGGAGVVSTCADYMKFADAVANGGTAANGYRLLSPRTVSLWHEDTLTPEQRACYDWGHLAGYGYGFGVRTLTDRAAAGTNAPVGEFGWGGAAGVWVILDTENRLALVYAQHMLNNQEPFISQRLRNILYACL